MRKIVDMDAYMACEVLLAITHEKMVFHYSMDLNI